MLSHPLLSISVGILATWRIASIIHNEEIFHPFRKLMGVTRLNENDPPEWWFYPDNFLGKLLSCFWCVSVWAGLLVVAIFFVPYHLYILLPFALSAGAIILDNFLDRTEHDFTSD